MNRGPQYKTAHHFRGELPQSNLQNKQVDYLPPLTMNWENIKVSSTKEPKVFGPPLWFSIHNSAAHYPPSPSPVCQQHTIKFIKSIPYIVPCDDCFIHAQNYISQFSDSDLLDITSTRAKYFDWSVKFHNFVNKRLGKRIYTTQEAYDMYHNSSSVKVLSYST
jgi:hypothetical protein